MYYYWHLLSDGCSSEDLPEVELVSLLEEQLPDYKLRVDSLYLYENPDWIQPTACHGRLPEIASPAHQEDSFRYMSESVFISPNTEVKNLDTKNCAWRDLILEVWPCSSSVS